MAEFNAYPELDYRPTDYSAIPMSEARLAGLKQNTQQSADEFPLLQQARQQSNELGAMELSQAKEQNRYQQLLRATQGVDFNDSQGAGKEWDKNLQALSDSAPDEATKNFFKQYIGHGTQAQAETIGRMYDAPKPVSGAKSGAAAGPGLGASPANALAAPMGLSEEQQAALGQQPPSKLQPLLGAADQALEDVKLVKNAGTEAPRVWRGLQMIHPALQSRGEYSPQLMDQLEAEATQVKQIASGVLGQQSMGIPTPAPSKILQGARGEISAVQIGPDGQPVVKQLQGPTFDPTTSGTLAERNRHNLETERLAADALAAKTAADKDTAAAELGTPDATSSGILAQTGLSYPGFLAITGQSQRLSRDRATRDAAFKEAETFANRNNVDVSTFGSQYSSLNDVLSKNLARVNQTKIMEGELLGTLENLKPVADAALSGNLQPANVAQAWAGGKINDPTVQQYSFQLGQLRNELAGYYAALKGKAPGQLDDADRKEAEGVILNGISSRGAGGLETAVKQSVDKMTGVFQQSVDRTQRAVWDLFGVGNNFKPKYPVAGASAGGAMNESALIEQGKAAIGKGADRAKVIERLKGLGVKDTSGL